MAYPFPCCLVIRECLRKNPKTDKYLSLNVSNIEFVLTLSPHRREFGISLKYAITNFKKKVPKIIRMQFCLEQHFNLICSMTARNFMKFSRKDQRISVRVLSAIVTRYFPIRLQTQNEVALLSALQHRIDAGHHFPTMYGYTYLSFI